ncbi:MFS transporter [Streptomyces sp. bgisy100]|uniref:MFS transporter n=1 Tax=Streptomyces sp. bgisy100 TaxID=3413783 RepID=UPI003D7437E6
MPSGKSASIFRDRNFSRLIAAQFISDTGTAVTALALPLIALDTLHASPFTLGLLGAASTLPQLLMSLWAGAVADRGDKRRMMVCADAVRCLLVVSIPLASAAHVLTLAHLFLVALLEASITLFFDAAYSSFPPQLFGKGPRLEEALGKLNASYSTALLVGPSLAGLFIAVSDASTAMVGDAVSYAFSFLLLLRITVKRPETQVRQKTRQGSSKAGFLTTQKEGLKYVFTHAEFRSIALANGVDSFFLAAWNTLWLLYVVRHLHWTPQAAGLVLGISAAGGILGSLVAQRATRRFGMSRVLLVSAFATAPCEAVTLLVNPGPAGQIAVLASFMVVMFFVFLYTTAARSYRQLSCPSGMLGRVMMTSRWLSWGGRPVGAFAGGLVGSAIGVYQTMLLAVAGLLLPPLILMFGLPWKTPVQPTDSWEGVSA